ncbi:MAG: NUDIX hydrolase [Candidatus Binatia bacterium]|nr:NUDIX hydrolase [Candidatus Binatia bacterium]MDG1959685.1 NUDIX hydrolase [Candidatus Binatia bacterium]MDG2010254.1 NUDIX hydrolase [Candidatus Binatia bacterium]HAC80623.1 NUDIX hydrolase [Deltaproteobacteria bacterium]
MHRKHLLEILRRYEAVYPREIATIERMRAFAVAHEDCFSRSCLPGHITASCWIVSSDGNRALLTHHAKLDRWLQLGGHADGDSDPFAVALREAREESGMADFIEASGDEFPVPLDIDIHGIPARRKEPAHFHYDLRYFLIAGAEQSLQISEESKDLRWVPRARITDLTDEESVLRLERKTRERPAKNDPGTGLGEGASDGERG